MSDSIRTMESDIKAVEQGGGEIVAPQPFTPPQFKPEEPKIGLESATGVQPRTFLLCVCLTKSEPILNGTDGALRAAEPKLNARAGPVAKPSACYGASKKQEFLFTP